MRIIAGEARGRRLTAPAGDETRPSSDKLRGALFNILARRVWDAHVLDLFGGTGAMALEALSRGARRAVIADKSFEAVRCIRRNVEAVLPEGERDRAVVIQTDYRRAIERMDPNDPFTMVVLDPPYRMREAYADALTRLRGAGLLAQDAVMILEYSQDDDIALPEGFICYDERRYGAARIRLVREADSE